jgi:hypothetical protein
MLDEMIIGVIVRVKTLQVKYVESSFIFLYQINIYNNIF